MFIMRAPVQAPAQYASTSSSVIRLRGGNNEIASPAAARADTDAARETPAITPMSANASLRQSRAWAASAWNSLKKVGVTSSDAFYLCQAIGQLQSASMIELGKLHEPPSRPGHER
jgi:hypothetical protein